VRCDKKNRLTFTLGIFLNFNGEYYWPMQRQRIFSERFSLNRISVLGGVAQCMVGTSVFGWRTFPDQWLTCDHFVGGYKVFAVGRPTRPTQFSIPQGSVND